MVACLQREGTTKAAIFMERTSSPYSRMYTAHASLRLFIHLPTLYEIFLFTFWPPQG